jgi:glycosyltransferase involved in cell wall biosynthesis
MDMISVVVPCYNEEQSVPLVLNALDAVAAGMADDAAFEFIFVDDGSSDGTLRALQSAGETDSRVKYISFSRNFGKEAAMFAGLEHAKGDYVAIIDADLQHPPELIATMYGLIKTGGCDCVAAKCVSRTGESRVRLLCAHAFSRLINKISGVKYVEGAMDFRLMTRRVADSVLSLKECCRFTKGIFSWVGYNTKWIDCEDRRRSAGASKWSFFKLLAYSLEGVAAFSSAPLFLSSIFGACFCALALVLLIFAVVSSAVSGAPFSGTASTLCVIFLVGGVQLFCTGLLGLYVSKTHLETKKRPIYLVKEKNI